MMLEGFPEKRKILQRQGGKGGMAGSVQHRVLLIAAAANQLTAL